MCWICLGLVEERLPEHSARQLDGQLAVQTQRLAGAQGVLRRQTVQAPGDRRSGAGRGSQAGTVVTETSGEFG